MKKILYFLCCLLSLALTIDMTYEAWMRLSKETFSFKTVFHILGLIGLGLISYEIMTKKYKWVQKLCK